MIVIPAIDLKQGRCVRLEQGDMEKETVFADDPVAQAKIWEDAGAGMIHIVDLDGAVEGKPKNEKTIRSICKSVKCGVQLGGGIRNIETAASYIEMGLARIILGSLLIKNPGAAREISKAYPEKVLAGIDARDGMAAGDGWTTTSSVSALDLAESLAGWPLGGIVYTDIARDGMMQGPNIEGMRLMADKSRFPLIASGGVTSMDDLYKLSEIKGVDGVIIGKALYTGAIDAARAIKEF
ncbi:MAG: 1-(5-phosphoribosyl)-5-[(5-phosphoribosylamino)methylideneamino]imidazole-4-carboxamide isomerase [Nitrospinota bacterium]